MKHPPVKEPCEAIISTPHTENKRAAKRRPSVEESPKKHTASNSETMGKSRKLLSRKDSSDENSLSLDDLKKPQQKKQTRNRKGRRGSETKLSLADESSQTLMNSSLMLDNSSARSVARSPSVCSMKPKRRVSFSKAEYREYKITVAVAPEVSFPLTLDWQFHESTTIDLTKDLGKNSQHRELKPLNIRKRQRRLLNMGIPRGDLVAMERRRRVQLAGEWAFGNDAGAHPFNAEQKILQYALY